jgi:hypothetical protein
VVIDPPADHAERSLPGQVVGVIRAGASSHMSS